MVQHRAHSRLEDEHSDAKRHSTDPTAYEKGQDGLGTWTTREGEALPSPYSCGLLTSYSAAVARLKGQIA